jgi:hypothetical protein
VKTATSVATIGSVPARPARRIGEASMLLAATTMSIVENWKIWMPSASDRQLRVMIVHQARPNTTSAETKRPVQTWSVSAPSASWMKRYAIHSMSPWMVRVRAAHAATACHST